jgi:hypothetical protein
LPFFLVVFLLAGALVVVLVVFVLGALAGGVLPGETPPVELVELWANSLGRASLRGRCAAAGEGEEALREDEVAARESEVAARESEEAARKAWAVPAASAGAPENEHATATATRASREPARTGGVRALTLFKIEPPRQTTNVTPGSRTLQQHDHGRLHATQQTTLVEQTVVANDALGVLCAS